MTMSRGSGRTLVELVTMFRAPEALYVLVAPTLDLLWQIVDTGCDLPGVNREVRGRVEPGTRCLEERVPTALL
jgi:hypothetical protein